MNPFTVYLLVHLLRILVWNQPLVVSDTAAAFIKTSADSIALVHAKVFDGSGNPALLDQTVLIKNGRILAIGDSGDVPVPEAYETWDASGMTLLPGLIGTHNHLRLPQGALLYTGPKLYLACGVTTIQTCGTGHPAEELALARAIEEGRYPGPEIIPSSPYFTGRQGRDHFVRFTEEKKVRDTIRYWARQGVAWFKVYRNTRPEDLRVIVDEAHRQGAKVTGHLCATSYSEAAQIGIDAIEHGFIHAFDFASDRVPGTCSGNVDFRSTLGVQEPVVQELIQLLIKQGVAISSTPAILEAQARGLADPRSLEAMDAFHVQAYQRRRKERESRGGEGGVKEAWLLRSLEFDRAFFRAGGLLTAGPDPGLHVLPGYGDQKNYELFIEAGFEPQAAVQILTANGARLLGRTDIGKVQPGMRADLLLLDGDLKADPRVIRNPVLVFKEGKGYDPQKLLQAVKRKVGAAMDDTWRVDGKPMP